MKPVLALLLAGGILLAQTDALLERADAAFRAGDLETAAGLARRIVAGDPAASHAHLILGVVAAQKKDWAAATRHFETVIRLRPSEPHAYFYLGQAGLYQGQWESAIRHFSKALERGYPERERLLVEMALAENEAGRPQRALDTLGKIAAAPGGALGAQYHAVAAFARDRMGRTGEAIESIRKAIPLDETNAHNREFLIGALIRMDRAPEALAEAIRAQRIFPDHADIQYAFALASYHVNESPLSGLALRNLSEAEPDSPRVLFAAGLLYRKQGRTDDALRAFRQAAARGAEDAHLLLGIVYKESGDYDAAEREYKEAERRNPRSGQLMMEMGKLFLARGDLVHARERLEKALEYMPDAPGLHYQLGVLYRRMGMEEKSQQHFRLVKEQ